MGFHQFVIMNFLLFSNFSKLNSTVSLIERYLVQSQSNPIKDQAQLKDNNVDEFKAIEIYGSFLHNNEIYIIYL